MQNLGSWKTRKYSSKFENKTVQHTGVKESCRWIDVWKFFRCIQNVYLSILSGHFDGLLSVTSGTKESKQQNRKKTKKENRKLVHMHTGNTKVSGK